MQGSIDDDVKSNRFVPIRIITDEILTNKEEDQDGNKFDLDN